MKLTQILYVGGALLGALVLTGTGAVAGNLKTPGLMFEIKNTGKGVKLRWLLEDKSVDHEYIIWRAPAHAPEKRTQIARLKRMDFSSAKSALGKEDQAALKLIFPKKTAKNRAEYNASLAQNDNRLNMLAYLSLLNPGVARVLGQYYEDTPPSEACLYTLEVIDKGQILAKASRGTTVGRADTLPMIHGVKAHKFDWGVGLKWKGFESYVGFNIFRSPFYEGPWEKINKNTVQVQAARNDDGTLDLAPYFYSDTTLTGTGRVYYKIQGLDFFTDPGPFSLPAAGKKKIDPRPAPLARPEVRSFETRIRISWQPAKAPGIMGYNIYRSFNYNEPGEKLNTTLLTEPAFTDARVVVDMNHFYVVTAVNSGGYESLPSLAGQGLPKDSTPPPQIIQAPRGNVTSQKGGPAQIGLSWQGVQAADLLGYRVYRTLKPDNLDWAMVTEVPLKQTQFTDTLSVHLSRYPFYYRVTSVDTHYNESPPSAPVGIKLPDITPPAAPSLTGARAGRGQVALTWQPVKARDLKGYKVYRRQEGGTTDLTPLPTALTAFCDSRPPRGVKLAYGVTAVDHTGNESPASAWMALEVRDDKGPGIESLTIKIVDGAVVVQARSTDPDAAGFDLMRSRNGREFVKCNTRRVKGNRCTDTRVMKGRRYFYRVDFWDRAGNRNQSRVQEIKLPR